MSSNENKIVQHTESTETPGLREIVERFEAERAQVEVTTHFDGPPIHRHVVVTEGSTDNRADSNADREIETNEQ